MGDPTMVVLVDMDGVLADFDRHVVDLLIGTCPELSSATTRSEIHLTYAYPEHRATIEELISGRDFFPSLPLVDGAVDGLRRIESAGFHPRVGSSPLSPNMSRLSGNS